MTAQPIELTDIDGLLDVLADYADQQAERDQDARRHTLAVALATQDLYQSRVALNLPSWLSCLGRASE